MIAHSAQLRWLPGTLRPHPVLTALINAARLVLAVPLALIAAALLLVGLAFALVTIALHPSLGRLLWGPLEETGPAGAKTARTSAKVAAPLGRHGGDPGCAPRAGSPQPPGEVERNRDGGHHDGRRHGAADRAARDLRLPPMPRRPYRPRLRAGDPGGELVLGSE